MLRVHCYHSFLKMNRRRHGYPSGVFRLSMGYICCIDKLIYCRGGECMAKAMTKSQLVAKIAEKASITKKSAGEILNFIAETAYKEAKNTFTLPGLGKLV